MAQCVNGSVVAVAGAAHPHCGRQSTAGALQIRLPCLKWKVNQLALCWLLSVHHAPAPSPTFCCRISFSSFVALDVVCTNLNANARKSTGASRLNALAARFHWTRISGCFFVTWRHCFSLACLSIDGGLPLLPPSPFPPFLFLHCFSVLHFSLFIITVHFVCLLYHQLVMLLHLLFIHSDKLVLLVCDTVVSSGYQRGGDRRELKCLAAVDGVCRLSLHCLPLVRLWCLCPVCTCLNVCSWISIPFWLFTLLPSFLCLAYVSLYGYYDLFECAFRKSRASGEVGAKAQTLSDTLPDAN